MKTITTALQYRSLLLLYLLLSTTPVIAAHVSIIRPDIQNMGLLLGAFLVALGFTAYWFWKKAWAWEDIGFKPRITFSSIAAHGVACLVAIFGGPWYARLLGYTQEIDFSRTEWMSIIQWSGIFCFIQEFLYRSFLMRLGDQFSEGNKMVNITLNILVFTSMHSIFSNQPWNMLFVLPGACIFAVLYEKYRNVYFITITHMVYSIVAFRHIVFHY